MAHDVYNCPVNTFKLCFELFYAYVAPFLRHRDFAVTMNFYWRLPSDLTYFEWGVDARSHRRNWPLNTAHAQSVTQSF